MKKILIILLLLGTSCEGEPEPKTVSLGEPFSLAYGESVLVAGEEIEVEFEAVLEDGRCPTDLKCVWEGLARIRLGLSGVQDEKVTLEPILYGYVLKEHTARHVPLDTLGYRFTLMQLDPYPVHADGPSALADYVTWLVISPYDLESDVINMVGSETFRLYLDLAGESFGIDSVAVVEDTLMVRVSYSGGCDIHDFLLVGTWAAIETGDPAVEAFLVHNGHGDTCEAFIREWRRFILTPIREQRPDGALVVIYLQDAPKSATYSY